jgi:chromosome segregation ATPase
MVYRDQLEQLQGRLRAQEARIRQKEEELFAAGRAAGGLERDLLNMRDHENGLRLEGQRLVQQRLAVEEQMQELRQRANADQIMLRLREGEAENLHRENKAVKGSMETLQHSLTQVMRENDQLKITLNEHERANIQMKSLFQTRDAQLTQLESDNERLRGVIDKERATSKKLEESLRLKIEQLQGELRDQQTRFNEAA